MKRAEGTLNWPIVMFGFTRSMAARSFRAMPMERTSFIFRVAPDIRKLPPGQTQVVSESLRCDPSGNLSTQRTAPWGLTKRSRRAPRTGSFSAAIDRGLAEHPEGSSGSDPSRRPRDKGHYSEISRSRGMPARAKSKCRTAVNRAACVSAGRLRDPPASRVPKSGARSRGNGMGIRRITQPRPR